MNLLPFREIEDIFDDLRVLPRLKRNIVPKYRENLGYIQEMENEIIVSIEIPGIEKQDIMLDATEDRIGITVEHKEEVDGEKEEGHPFIRKSSSKFYKSISLPHKVNPINAKANYNNGVLEVILPKLKIGTRIKVE
jgi:HSP20 family protein